MKTPKAAPFFLVVVMVLVAPPGGEGPAIGGTTFSCVGVWGPRNPWRFNIAAGESRPRDADADNRGHDAPPAPPVAAALLQGTHVILRGSDSSSDGAARQLESAQAMVLVSHSLGGVNIALACELFPEKLAAAAFVSAFMPDHRSPTSYVLEKFVEGRTLDWMDTESRPQDPEGKLPTSMLFGPLVTRAKFFQLCSPEDLMLGRSLMRVGSMFVDDLRLQPPYTEARYGSVRKVYVVFKDDHAIVEGFQRWMAHNYPVDEVKEIDGADESGPRDADDDNRGHDAPPAPPVAAALRQDAHVILRCSGSSSDGAAQELESAQAMVLLVHLDIHEHGTAPEIKSKAHPWRFNIVAGEFRPRDADDDNRECAPRGQHQGSGRSPSRQCAPRAA